MKNRIFKTVCARDCYDTCFLKVEVDSKGRIVSIRGDPENPVTGRHICPRGLKDGERQEKNRVLYPYIRSGKIFQRTAWEEALAKITMKLRHVLATDGPEAVLYLDYPGNSGMLTYHFPARIWNALGVTKTDHALCSKSGHEAIALHYGLSYGMMPEELLSQKLIVFWGFNAFSSASNLFLLSQKARKNGAQIAVIDPRKSESAKEADLWLSPYPGSDVTLAYGIARYIIQKDRVDIEFIKKYTSGYDQFREEAMKWTPERVEKLTGIKWETIEKLGMAYCSLRPSATMIGIGFQKSVHGAESVRAISLLPGLLGMHRGFFYSNKNHYSVDMHYLSGAALTSRPSRIISQVALSKAIREGKYRFIYITGMNPAISVPDQNSFRTGLAQEDTFIVVHETHWTETAYYSNVVLPAATYLEKDDLVIPWSHRYVRISRKVQEPPGESRNESLLMREIAERIGLNDEWLYSNPWECAEYALRDALDEGTFHDLKGGETLKLKIKKLDEYQTPTGKLEFYSQKARVMGFSPLPEQIPLQIKKGEFILLSSALPEFTHSQFREVFGLIPQIVTMNPDDAKHLGIITGDIVSLKNDLGHVTLRVKVTDGQPKGVLWTPKHLMGLNGEPLNSLVPGNTQLLGNGSTINSTIISEVKKA